MSTGERPDPCRLVSMQILRGWCQMLFSLFGKFVLSSRLRFFLFADTNLPVSSLVDPRVSSYSRRCDFDYLARGLCYLITYVLWSIRHDELRQHQSRRSTLIIFADFSNLPLRWWTTIIKNNIVLFYLKKTSFEEYKISFSFGIFYVYFLKCERYKEDNNNDK